MTNATSRINTMRLLHATLCASFLLATGAVPAASVSKVFGLAPKADPAINHARIAAVEGAAGPAGHRFELGKLTIRQPVLIVLRATEAKDRLQLQLMKFIWDHAEQTAVTDVQGFASFLVKTEGDLRIQVTGERADTQYSLFALVGDEVKQPLPSIFVPMPPGGKDEAAALPGTALFAVGCVALVVSLALFLQTRHRDRRKLGRSVCLFLAVTAAAGAPLRAESDPLTIRFTDWMGKFIANGDFFKIYDTGVKAREAWNKVRPLTRGDASKQENYDPAGAPQVPSHCADVPPAVSIDPATGEGHPYPRACACYEEAVAHVNRVRSAFERLRAAAEDNKEFVEAQIAFGDSVAAIPSTGMGWYAAKKKILEAERVFEEAYDKKYAELLKSFEQALREISACEEEAFNEKNWYERFGFVYYQFIADRYRRR